MPKVTLSFDNGPEPEVTRQVLDTLAKHAVKASFFVMGRKAATHEGRELAMRAAGEGHWIGNHTYSHTKPLGELDRVAALREFDHCEETLAWLHQRTRLFRPYGRQGKLGRHLLHPAVVERLIAGRFSAVLWNCVVGDWREPDAWMALAMEHCLSHEWTCLVLHDQPGGAMRHLDGFLDGLRDRVEIVQEFPDSCVPIRAGRVTGAIGDWVCG